MSEQLVHTRRAFTAGFTVSLTGLLLPSACSSPEQGSELVPSSTTNASTSTIPETYNFDVPPGLFEFPTEETPLPTDPPIITPSTLPIEDVPDFSSREGLVSFLDSRNAFNLCYTGNPEDAKNDLLDSTKSSDKLISLLARLTFIGFYGGAEFDILLVNTGHAQYTLGADGRPSGRTSQHVVGQAIDIRPRLTAEGDTEAKKTNPSEAVLVSNPLSRERAFRLGSYVLQHERDNIHQLIVSGFNPNYNRGALIPYTSWPSNLIELHWDHLHIGIRP